MQYLPFLLALLLSLCACDPSPGGDRIARDTGPGTGTDMGGPGTAFDMSRPPTPAPTDGGRFDPFDPDAACGSTTVPTERVPGSLLLVFDRSGSMDSNASGGGGTKWALATSAINRALAGVSDDLNIGLMLFPYGETDECSVGPDAITVDVGPLTMTRGAIASALGTSDAGGGSTPIGDALRAGWSHLEGLGGRGQKGVILVTDGQESCETSGPASDAVLAEAATRHDAGFVTYAVGLDESNNFLSTLAVNGGTPRSTTCLAECQSPSCSSDADCSGGMTCSATTIAGITIPGTCQCTMDSHCPPMQTCEMSAGIPGFPSMNECRGPSNCCHYDAEGASFESDFQTALEEIATRFLDSCVFEVPRDGVDMFDPNRVNVGITFDGEMRQVLPQSGDPATDSWNYTTPEQDAIIIQGPICERLRMSAAEVEIVVGCPTILI